MPITQLVASNDDLASPERNTRNRHNLPPSARWVMIDGGNHSQFADYGFQPGDRVATRQARLANAPPAKLRE